MNFNFKQFFWIAVLVSGLAVATVLVRERIKPPKADLTRAEIQIISPSSSLASGTSATSNIIVIAPDAKQLSFVRASIAVGSGLTVKTTGSLPTGYAYLDTYPKMEGSNFVAVVLAQPGTRPVISLSIPIIIESATDNQTVVTADLVDSQVVTSDTNAYQGSTLLATNVTFNIPPTPTVTVPAATATTVPTPTQPPAACTDWKGETSQDLGLGSLSSFSEVVWPNNKIQQSALLSDGQTYKYRFNTWRRISTLDSGAYDQSTWTSWGTSPIGTVDGQTSFGSFTEQRHHDDKIKQIVVSVDGTQAWSRKAAWDARAGFYPSTNYTPWAPITGLPTGPWKSISEIMLGNLLKQNYLSLDGKTLKYRYATWNSTTQVYENWSPMYSASLTDKPGNPYRSFKQTTLPDGRIKEAVLDNTGILRYKYGCWQNVSPTIAPSATLAPVPTDVPPTPTQPPAACTDWKGDATVDLGLGADMRSYSEFVFPDNRIKQSVLQPDGQNYKLRYATWSNGAYGNWTNWSPLALGTIGGQTVFGSLSEQRHHDNKIKQVVTSVDGTRAWSRKGTWNTSTSTYSNWENWAEVPGLPIGPWKSISEIMTGNLLKQNYLSLDGKTLKYRYATWNSTTQVYENWSPMYSTSIPSSRSFKQTTFPDGRIKQSTLDSSGTSVSYKYGCWQNVTPTVTPPTATPTSAPLACGLLPDNASGFEQGDSGFSVWKLGTGSLTKQRSQTQKANGDWSEKITLVTPVSNSTIYRRNANLLPTSDKLVRFTGKYYIESVTSPAPTTLSIYVNYKNGNADVPGGWYQTPMSTVGGTWHTFSIDAPHVAGANSVEVGFNLAGNSGGIEFYVDNLCASHIGGVLPLPTTCPQVVLNGVAQQYCGAMNFPNITSVELTNNTLAVTVHDATGVNDIGSVYVGMTQSCSNNPGEAGGGNFEKNLTNFLGVFYSFDWAAGGVASKTSSNSCTGGQGDPNLVWDYFTDTASINISNKPGSLLVKSLSISNVTDPNFGPAKKFVWTFEAGANFPRGLYNLYAMAVDKAGVWQNGTANASWTKWSENGNFTAPICTTDANCSQTQYCSPTNQCVDVFCPLSSPECKYFSIANHTCELLNSTDGTACTNGTCQSGVCVTPTTIPGSVSLTVRTKLQNVSSKKANKNFRVVIKQGNAVKATKNLAFVASSGGVYSATIDTNLPAGNYDVLIKGPAHLQRKLSLALAVGSNTADFTSLSLLAGDIYTTGDNRVDTNDLSVLRGFYRPGTAQNVIADLNLDGKVDVLDYSLLKSNYSKTGDN